MTRLALVLAAIAVLGTGCYVADTPRGSVDIAWRFARYAPGGTSPLVYYGCATAGVDSVLVQFGNGAAQQVPCRDSVGDGALLDGVPAAQQTVTITGRRAGVDLYRSTYTVAVVSGQVTPLDLDIHAIADDLEVQTRLLTADGGGAYTSCANAGFTTFTYKVVDSAGTTVATGSASCSTGGVADPGGYPDLSFVGAGALDRDTYTIRLQAPASGAVTFDSASSVNSCSGQPIDHFAPDTGNANAWSPAMYYVGGNGVLCR